AIQLYIWHSLAEADQVSFLRSLITPSNTISLFYQVLLLSLDRAQRVANPVHPPIPSYLVPHGKYQYPCMFLIIASEPDPDSTTTAATPAESRLTASAEGR